MDNLDTALKLMGLVEELVPSGVGLVNALKTAHSQGITVEQLLADAQSKFDQVADQASKEIK